MPDIAPPRPVSGSPIATAWGTAVHDAIEGMQAGAVVVNVSAAGSGDLAVTFPRAFTAAPQVLISIVTTTSVWYAVAHSVSATGFTYRAVHRDGTASTATLTANWLAIGSLATPG